MLRIALSSLALVSSASCATTLLPGGWTVIVSDVDPAVDGTHTTGAGVAIDEAGNPQAAVLIDGQDVVT